MGDHKHKKDRDSRKSSSSKRHHKESSSSSHREHKKHKKSSSSRQEPEIDYSDPSLWVEAESQTAELTPAEHLLNQQKATEANEQTEQDNSAALPKEQEARHGWMLDGGLDFGSMGTARVREEDKPKPNPDQPFVSDRELNKHLVQGLKFDEYPEEQKKSVKFGDAGSNWRMMKLKRTIEQAEDEGRSVREVGIERYGSAEKFDEALAEREYLDKRKGGGRDRRGDDRRDKRSDDRRDRKSSDRRNDDRREQSRKYVFNDTEAQKSSFKRPAEATKQAPRPVATPLQPPTPSIMQTATPPQPIISALSRDELNKLNAKLVKAKIMGSANVDALEKEYQTELEKFEHAEKNNVQVLPTMDSQGRLYDYALQPGNKDQPVLKGKQRYEGTHDKVTGERIKYGTADESLSIADMVRQERGGGRSFDMDMEFANRIVSDAGFENNLDYMDDKADIMASKKGVSEEQKMRRAVTDYKRTQENLEKCKFCYHDGKPPQLAMISLGTTCYLALPNVQEITPGNCLIIPLNHVTSTLECDDDVWTEIRNFQKCLMKMFHEQNKGVVFMETVVNIRAQRHTAIEVIPIPYGAYEDAPAYFKEAIMACDEEWSQHKKLIDTSERGFRLSMVKNLPYFHVWIGLDKGYGHVIENAKEFPYWFGKEVIAGMLDLGPELWRKPRYHHPSDNHRRQQEFLKSWEKWDWTAALQ